nr:uncharacterized protein LOC110375163 [Helicoverpa armigera]XP_021188862.2 uncharacterized protein LOC110375163 [Helicoverpa armigera]XP_021188863.2 uncharacterized protein LOC110375163 [Helicoverpa armigera]
MTLSESFDGSVATTVNTDSSVNLNSLYCSHLWTNSNLRSAIITAPPKDRNVITYCYTCKGKIRKYELKPPRNFTPHNHSTPNKDITIERDEAVVNERQVQLIDTNVRQDVCSYNKSFTRDLEPTNVENQLRIPSISQQIDSSFRQKYTSYEMDTNSGGRQRLRKSLRGFGCIINFASADSPVKKRTQIQACSISVMIVAIVIISFILVNFTNPNLKGMTNKISTTVVPTKNVDINETASAITKVYLDLGSMTEVNTTDEYLTTTEYDSSFNIDNSTLMNVISKIRKNIRTYPKFSRKADESEKPKEVNNRDLSQRFCSCQRNEICMLDENSGKSVCRKPIDHDDPTGCGGLCALETEACQLVDKARGVRVCRLLTLVTCSPDEWRCRNGLCVPAEARCDGSIQCYDRSDEMYCECDLTKQFRCGHSISCFSHTKLCDGVIDCWDGYDEVNCTTECPADQFTCTDGQCILSSRFCDGLADCADGSDEPDGCGGSCGAHELRCRNQRCVPRAAQCDNHDNCGDLTDELHCSK